MMTDASPGKATRVLLAAAFTVAVGFVIAFLPASLRAPHADHVLPLDSACADREYSWARSETDRLATAEDRPDSVSIGTPSDSVFVSNYSFRPGRPSQLVSSGLLHNRSESTIEIRGYRVEFLSASGEVVGEGRCRGSWEGSSAASEALISSVQEPSP